MTNADRQNRHRKKRERERKLENPKLRAKQARRAEREKGLAGMIFAPPDERFRRDPGRS